MWNEPYLETCCRAALHRLVLTDGISRPPGLKDGPCLERLTGMGLAAERPDGRFALTTAGANRHATEIMHQPVPPAVPSSAPHAAPAAAPPARPRAPD